MKITKYQLGETKVKDAEGLPLIVYHGTNASFDAFSDSQLQSLGFHCGDIVQANHFAGTDPGARVVPVFLLIRNLIDIRPNDAGFLRPKQTAICLYISDLLTFVEAASIIDSNTLSLVAHSELESQEIRQRRNRQITAVLGAKGFDGILYNNRQEPGDGVGRDA